MAILLNPFLALCTTLVTRPQAAERSDLLASWEQMSCISAPVS